MSESSVLLEARARSGDADAQLQLGAAHEAQGHVPAARAWFAQAAKAGRADALRLLGLSLIREKPTDTDKGVNMMRAAADKGDAEAAHICAMLAAGDEALPDRWQVARQCLEIAQARGWTPAQSEIAALDADIAPPETVPRTIFDAPRISVFDGFASPAECAWLIAHAGPHLVRAKVYDPDRGGGREEWGRTNSAVEFDIARMGIVLHRLRSRIAGLFRGARLEVSSVLHYAPGQEFTPHFDFLDPARPGYARDIAENGQRIATFLIYLNDDFDGGETDFPKLGWRFKGRPGDALLFWNVDVAGAPDLQTFHAGLATTRGEKWLFSQWVRAPGVSPPPARS